MLIGLVSNLFFRYGYVLYILLAPIIAPVLFDTKDFLTALIWTYSILAINIVTRPLGALLFGWIGDSISREQALFYSLTGATVATLAMGCIPFIISTHLCSPFWTLLLIRGVQSFCAAGESTNGAVFILEQVATEHRGWISSWYDVSSAMGWLLASMLTTLLGWLGLLDTQWPWLCTFGGITGTCGLMLRWTTRKSRYIPHHAQLPLAFFKFWKTYHSALLAQIIASGFCNTIYVITFTFMNAYILLVTSCSQQDMLEINMLFILLDILLLPCFGYLATRWNYQKQMWWSAISTCIAAFPLFYLLHQASWYSIFIIRLCLLTLGIAFSATYYAWAQSLVPADARCRVGSFAQAIGSHLIGAPAAAIALWLYQKTTWIVAPAIYLVITAAAAAIVIHRIKPYKL